MNLPEPLTTDDPLASLVDLCRVVAHRLRLDAEDRGPSEYLPAELPAMLDNYLRAVVTSEHLAEPEEGTGL